MIRRARARRACRRHGHIVAHPGPIVCLRCTRGRWNG